MSAVVDTPEVAVERLIAAGCKRDRLLPVLAAFRRAAAPQPPRRLRRRAARQEPTLKEDLEVVEQRLKQVANVVARLGENADVWLMLPNSSTFARHLVDFYADVAYLRRLAGTRPLQNALLAWLLYVIHSDTGEWHDAEVAFLVSDARGKDYDLTTHAKWRTRHQRLIARTRTVSGEQAMRALIDVANSQRPELTRSGQEEGVARVGSDSALSGLSTGRASKPST